MKKHDIIRAGIGAVFLAGCATHVTVVPVDAASNIIPTAHVAVDGKEVGVGPSVVDVKGAARVSIDGGPEWTPISFYVGDKGPERLEVPLKPNGLYRTTTADENHLVNQSADIRVAQDCGKTWWSSTVAAVSGAGYEIALMDPASGFLRTAWRETAYGNDSVHRRMIGNVVTQDPFVWRMRYEVEMKQADMPEWRPYERGFADDFRTLQEIRGRVEHCQAAVQATAPPEAAPRRKAKH